MVEEEGEEMVAEEEGEMEVEVEETEGEVGGMGEEVEERVEELEGVETIRKRSCEMRLTRLPFSLVTFKISYA